jgi:hypothetical protein
MNNEQENSKSSIYSNDEYDEYEGDDCYEGDEGDEVDDEEKKKDILLGTMWQEISDIQKKLSVFDRSQVHKYVKEHMQDEVIDIQAKFKEEFKHYKRDNPLRIQVLLLLSSLGITIYETADEYNKKTDNMNSDPEY